MRTSRFAICAALAVLLLTFGAAADERANAPTVTGETGLFTLFTGETVPQGQWSFGAYYNNWDRVFEFDDRADLDWNRFSVSFAYGITDAWEISVMAPYEYLQPDFPGADPDSESGVGDLRVGTKFRVFENASSSFAINLFTELPTGAEEVLGSDDAGFGAGVAYSAGNWAFNVGYRAPGDLDGGITRSDEILAGVGYTAPISEQFDWISELNATLPTDSDEAIFDDSLDLVLGGRYWLGPEDPWAFNFALRTDLLQLSETDEHCPIGGLLGFTWFPRMYSVPEPPPPPPPPEYELTVEKRGDCDGSVTSSPAGIDCGGTCSAVYQDGTVVDLSAVPAEDCRFDGWTGDADCSDGSVTMNGDRMCVANFSAVPPPPPPPPPTFKEIERTCLFDANSSRVNNACKAILDEVALLMKDNPDAPALVIGYTDDRGSERSNVEMGRRRAESVKNWLVTRHAIDSGRITVESRGEADPAADNATAEGRKQNRRAVIRVTVEEEA